MNGGAVQVLYDGDGNRVAKSANGVVTRYLVDDLNPTGLPQVMDELTNGVVTRTYTYGLQRISEDQAINSTWVPSFYSYDGMGSARQLTNADGTSRTPSSTKPSTTRSRIPVHSRRRIACAEGYRSRSIQRNRSHETATPP